MDDREALLRSVMKRQASLGIRLACVFIALLILLPLVNLYFPKLAETNVAGFTATWLCLGVLFYPLTWILSGYFVKRSDQIEQDLLVSDLHVSAASNASRSDDTVVGTPSESTEAEDQAE